MINKKKIMRDMAKNLVFEKNINLLYVHRLIKKFHLKIKRLFFTNPGLTSKVQ